MYQPDIYHEQFKVTILSLRSRYLYKNVIRTQKDAKRMIELGWLKVPVRLNLSADLSARIYSIFLSQ